MPRPVAEYKQTHSHYSHKELTRVRRFILPVPWSQGTSWGTLKESRSTLARCKSLCLLCGEKVDEGVVVVSDGNESFPTRFPRIKPKAHLEHYYPDDLNRVDVVDHAPLHERCGKLTVAHCPTLNKASKHDGVVLRPYSNKRPE